MESRQLVDVAERASRKRAIGFAVATLVFVMVQLFGRPVFVGGGIASGPRFYLWVANAAVLLLCLLTGGGLMNRRQIRSLINDEVARSHYRSAVTAGFWVAMTVALAFFVVPALQARTAAEAVYAVVTSSVVVALLLFSHLEYHAHGDE
jgi:hypothetical protein